MRAKYTFSSEAPIVLTKYYNRAIQGLIYNLLDTDFANWLHDTGFKYGRRSFKLFTFSRLFGPFTRRGDLIDFGKKVQLYISSPIDKFVGQLCNNLLKKKLVLETNFINVESIEFLKKPTFSPSAIIRTLSPVTVYSTLLTPQNTKKTYYYSPYEKEFSELILQNLLKKADMLNIAAKKEFKIRPYCVKDVYVSFKETLIRGWVGEFEVEGDPNLLEIAYETGLGSKNSAGFGMIELIENA